MYVYINLINIYHSVQRLPQLTEAYRGVTNRMGLDPRAKRTQRLSVVSHTNTLLAAIRWIICRWIIAAYSEVKCLNEHRYREKLPGRMNRCCVNCSKTLLIHLNFLCWLCGAFVVAFGEFQMIHSQFASLVPSFWPVYPANTLVVSGTIVTCVCYLGVLGGMKENRCMLITFFVLLFILMLVELAMACVFLVYSTEIDTYFEKDLMKSLEIYRQSSPESNTTIKDDFDAVQDLFRCCGVHGVADWKGDVPVSCCSSSPCSMLLHPPWPEGCLVKLRNWFARNYLNTGAGVVTMFIIQELGILNCQRKMICSTAFSHSNSQ
ncbi:leukocyte surface antigen CD53-like [Perca flavescens]|uniref:leukocyte surface antigen CD53-like n=1 Tax=Perca flavescens TaxID=8167 RepID=UPI00106E2944|nr:leukocyte surface antigen CD53-like [Perca flavescens]